MSTEWEFKSYTKKYHRSKYPAIDPSKPSNSAAGKVVIITGGGSGLGPHIAQAFITAGARAIGIIGRRAKVLEETKKELEAFGKAQIVTAAADVTDVDGLNKAVTSIKEQTGPINVFVANAGYLAKAAKLTETDIGDWWSGFEINVLGTLAQFRAFAANKAEKDAAFVSVNTLAAHAGPFPKMSGYAVSKLATLELVAYAAAEYPEVRVVSFHPGVLETDMGTKAGLPLSRDDSKFRVSNLTR